MELKSYVSVLASLRELIKLKSLKDVSANTSLNAGERETALREYASKKRAAWENAKKAIAELGIELAQYESADRDALRSILARSRDTEEQPCQVDTEERLSIENIVREAYVSTDLVEVSSLLSDIMRIVRPREPAIEELESQSLVLMLEISRWYAKNGSREPSAAERAWGPLSMRTIYFLLNSWVAMLPENSPPLLKCGAMLYAIRKQFTNAAALSVESVLCECSNGCKQLSGQVICRKLIPSMTNIIKSGIPVAPEAPTVCRTKNEQVTMVYCGQELKKEIAETCYMQDALTYLTAVAKYWQAVALQHASADMYQLPTN